MKINKYIGLLLLPALAACSESDDLMYHIEEPADTMHLTASATELTLDQANASGTAVTFTWGNAADRGPSASITYNFRIDWSDNMFENAEMIEVTGNEYSISVEDLNDMLQEWSITPGTQVEVEAQIIATVTDPTLYRKPEYSTATILVTGYKPSSVPATISNSAVDPKYNEWCGAMSTPNMTEVVVGKQWSWTGWFEADKPVTINTDAGELATVSAPKDGYFTMTYNKKTDTATWDICVPWSACYFVGDAMPSGWDITNPTQFTQDAENPEIFVFEGALNTGEFKGYYQTGGWGNDAFMPPYGGYEMNSAIEEYPFVLNLGANPDDKWNVTEAGNVRMEVNLNLMKITVKYI